MMRCHELCLQHWLNQHFVVSDGYPTPVVFTSPMDAFSQFSLLWKSGGDQNPFNYLLSLKDANGAPRYLPYPQPPRYPLLSVHRQGWRPRACQSWGLRTNRWVGWPTVSTEGVTKPDLGNVIQVSRPSAWDFRYQIDYYCMRPDTQSEFVTKLMQSLSYFGGQAQTWVEVVYPGLWGRTMLHMVLEGDIQPVTPEAPADGEAVVLRTSFTVSIEGYCPEINYVSVPAFWTLVQSVSAVSPADLGTVYTTETDLRPFDGNPVLNTRLNVPPAL